MSNPQIILSADAAGALILPSLPGYPGIVVMEEHLSLFCENPLHASVCTLAPFAASVLGDVLGGRNIKFMRVERDLVLYPEEEEIDILTADGLAIRYYDPPQHHLLAYKNVGDIVITSRLAVINGRDKMPIILRAHTPSVPFSAHARDRFTGLGETSELPRLVSDAWRRAFGWAPPPVDTRPCGSLWRV